MQSLCTRGIAADVVPPPKEPTASATDITKPASTPPPAARTTDIFGAMRGEMDRVFERFERGISSLPALFSRTGSDWLWHDRPHGQASARLARTSDAALGKIVVWRDFFPRW